MDFMKRSSGVAKAGLTTGIIGTSLGVINSLGGLGALAAVGMSGNGTAVTPAVVNAGCGVTPVMPVAPVGFGGYTAASQVCACSEDHCVNRYELSLQQQIAEKDSQIALRDANTYNDQKALELYKYIDDQIAAVNARLCQQEVLNQKTADSFQMLMERMDCMKANLADKIADECRERRCADNTIITYANATFYPKQVVDVTVGTTATPQERYNPLPACDCCSGR